MHPLEYSRNIKPMPCCDPSALISRGVLLGRCRLQSPCRLVALSPCRLVALQGWLKDTQGDASYQKAVKQATDFDLQENKLKYAYLMFNCIVY